MNIDSIYFRGYSCFKKDWAGLDKIKPINVIIGRNNSGKSHLLDLVEALCKEKLDKLFDREWHYRCRGVLDEASLKEVFSENTGEGYGNDWSNHGQYFVGKEVTWKVTVSGEEPSRKTISNVKYPDDFDITYDSRYSRSLPERSLDRRRSKIYKKPF